MSEQSRPVVSTASPKSGTRARPATLTAYAALAWVFVVCVGVQVFLAGMAVFVDPLNWVRHVTFVHYFELIPVLMLILAFAGKMPKGKGFYLRPALLIFLVGLQYFFVGTGQGVLAALHPVNALFIFWLAAHLATSAGPFRLERS